MNNLKNKFYAKYADTQVSTIRSVYNEIDWSNRFIGIKGSRGVGKTTLLLQYLKKNFRPDNTVLYVSLDDLYFAENKLYALADLFYKKGGKLLVLDEIHRYPNWSQELKNIYDDLHDLKLIFTGSSMLHLQKAKADLSRRVVMYEMPGLSFREYINFENKTDFPFFDLKQILQNHVEIAVQLIEKIKPLSFFEDYLSFGYYPFYLENKQAFHSKLSEIILTTLEVDIPQFEKIQVSGITYLKKLLRLISHSVPYKPNMNGLSQRTGISLNTMKSYINYLHDSRLISLLYFKDFGINSMNKPEKIYLSNPNLMYNLADTSPDIGNVRETFFYNQLNQKHKVRASKYTDFMVDDIYSFETGGSNKNKKQISDLKNSYLVKDNLEIGSESTIPLWLFGFLY